jgi:hypothetical protein
VSEISLELTLGVSTTDAEAFEAIEAHWTYEDAVDAAGGDAILLGAVRVLFTDSELYLDWIINNNEDPIDSDAWLEHCVAEALQEFV